MSRPALDRKDVPLLAERKTRRTAAKSKNVASRQFSDQRFDDLTKLERDALFKQMAIQLGMVKE